MYPSCDVRQGGFSEGSAYLYVLDLDGNRSDAYLITIGSSLSLRSDVDNSSSITSTDAMLTLRNSLSLDMSATAWQTGTATGDANCDGNSNSTDAMLILRKSLDLDMSGTAWCEE